MDNESGKELIGVGTSESAGARKAWGADPLRSAAALVASGSWIAILAGAEMLSVILYYIPGFALSYVFLRHGSHTRLLDSHELPIAILVYSVAIPAVILAYVRMPALVAETLDDLENGGVVQSPADKPSSLAEFVAHIYVWLGRRIWYLVSIGVVLVGAAWWQHVLSHDTGVAGHWWYGNKWYYAVLWLPTVLFFFYVAAVTTLRGVMAAIGLGLLFKRFSTVFRPMHRDGQGGFGPVDRFILRVGFALFFAALTGVVLSVNSFLNASRENAVIPLAFSVVYVVVSPVVLFFPLLMARRSMRRAAESELARIASEYEEVTRRIGDPLAPSPPTAVLPLLQHQANLLQRHQLATSRLNAWPIGIPTAILAGLSILGWILGTASAIVTLLRVS